MARMLSKEEQRRLAADFDPPVLPDHPETSRPEALKDDGPRVRITANLTKSQHDKLKTLSTRLKRPMSRLLGDAVEELCKKYR